ncbi:predicted protein, partial [Nematostella vectensis]
KGFPPPVITWSRSGQTIPYDRRQSIDNGTLLIGNVQKSDSGKYTCTAVNTAGERDSVTMTVSIVVPSKFVTEPRDQQVLREYTAQLSCQTTGYPPARVEWSKLQGSSFVPLGDNHRFQQLLNGTLVIRNASKRDEGRYSCHAYN